ncbi:electron transfer flavoprotein subunit beta/FixA family protein [Corynebacterium hindlerae]|uniref:electron transfer flavoprotein subunit beta/FixA family protein n=1 Tax=Corynebacterium hindlerae TaxID=699041 RepID=UPI001AD71A65|nr:electron transfer flavoprotein subunit beta/FixA family protein [Corynebacterium hindlerae]QTH60547.1 electron transfer flavoprotein subunit beta/FixA family protein [Corynebacterium hindlerae]
MRIAVLAKEVPDTYGDRNITLETGLVDRDGAENVPDEICERAVEAALALKGDGDEVHLLAMAPATAEKSIRKGLAMGADEAVLITDEELRGADLSLTAEVLARAVEKQGYDLVIAGNLSTDGNAGVLPTMISEHLNWPHLTQLTQLQVDGKVQGIRSAEEGDFQMQAELPAVVSITESFPDPRYPNFKGIMAAKKKQITTLTCADLGVDPLDFSHPRLIMTEASQRPPREAGVKITDDGTAAAQLADFLAANSLIK